NGRRLDQILSDLCRHWPTDIRRVSLIGHGMGGLVARAASHHGHAGMSPWFGVLTDVISLGSPVAGAGWERTAHIGAGMLRKAVGHTLHAPPVSTGHIGPHEWTGCDVTRLWGHQRQTVAPLPHVDYRFVVPSVPDSRLGGEVGPPASVPVDALTLLDHEAVAELLVTWLNDRETRPPELISGSTP